MTDRRRPLRPWNRKGQKWLGSQEKHNPPSLAEQAGFAVTYIRDSDGTVKPGTLRMFPLTPRCRCCGRAG